MSNLPTICLAASGGGHIRQILDLKPMWRDYPHFIITEDTALGRSLADEEEVHFVPHFALGQAKLGDAMAMVRGAFVSVGRSWRIIRDKRPDLFITTGAGSQVFAMIFARLHGARVVLIDSFARFHAPSAFARLAGRLAHVRIAQSAASGAKWPGALVFDPFRLEEGERPAKEPLLFATVGATLPFERLVTLVEHARDAGLIPETIVLQHGAGGRAISGVRSVAGMAFAEVQDLLRRADVVVCHGGTGSLITAMRAHCRVVAIPREFERGEHYDNHQAEIVAAFEERGLLVSAGTDEEFAKALVAVRTRPPVAATTDPTALIEFLKSFTSRLTLKH